MILCSVYMHLNVKILSLKCRSTIFYVIELHNKMNFIQKKFYRNIHVLHPFIFEVLTNYKDILFSLVVGNTDLFCRITESIKYQFVFNVYFYIQICINAKQPVELGNKTILRNISANQRFTSSFKLCCNRFSDKIIVQVAT